MRLEDIVQIGDPAEVVRPASRLLVVDVADDPQTELGALREGAGEAIDQLPGTVDHGILDASAPPPHRSDRSIAEHAADRDRRDDTGGEPRQGFVHPPEPDAGPDQAQR